MKGNQSRAWTTFIECISAVGRVVPPLIIFKAQTIQAQWFEDGFNQPGWHFARSDNGWTSNVIALEWLQKVFLLETEPSNPADARLLIVNGHGSHATDEFIWDCFSNNVYLLFMPAHTSHVLQPLDLTCFFPLKAAYRRLIADLAELTDSAPVGKLRFLQCYAQARIDGLRANNIKSGFRASGLYPINRLKPLSNPHVRKAAEVAAQRGSIATSSSLPISPQGGQDLTELLRAATIDTSEARRAVRAAAAALDEKNVEITALNREIERLNAKIERLQPQKRRKIHVDANERIVSMDQVLANRVHQAQLYAYKQKLREIANLADSDSEAEEELEEEAIPEIEVISEEEEEDDTEDEDDIGVNMASTATRAGRAIRKPARYRN